MTPMLKRKLRHWNLAGRLDIPDLPLELRKLIAQIPPRRVTTYGRLATALGSVVAARWVATYLLDPEAAAALPAHRVVLRDGGLGSYYTGRLTDKARALRAEGIEVRHQSVDLEQSGFDGFVSSRPLEELRRTQEELLTHLDLRPPDKLPQFVAGVDVSYVSSTDAVGAYALVEVATGRLEWSATLRRNVRFPYIPGFLSFRELPLYLELLDYAAEQGKRADVVFVDGAGILHPRRAGIATHLGIVSGIPTVGISKKRLCGEVDLKGMAPGEGRPVKHVGETLATACTTTSRGNPIYVSPGQAVNVDFAFQLARLLLRGHKLPEPTHWAHKLSRQAAKLTANP